MNREDLCVALIGADDIQAHEMAGRLRDMGLSSHSILTFGECLGQMELSFDEEGAEVLLPLEREHLEAANVWVLFGRDAKARETLLQWAQETGTLVLDLAPSGSRAVHCLDPRQEREKLSALGSYLVIPEPSAYLLARLLRILPPDSIERVDCHLLLPASGRGEAGVRELFQQSANLLNFRPIPTEVWGRQLAFNLLPLPEALQPELFGAQVRTLWGQPVDVTCVTLQTSVFHGATLSAFVKVEDARKAEKVMLEELAGVPGFRCANSTPWPSPLEASAQDAPTVGVRSLSDGLLWIWLLYDNVKAGKGAMGAAVIERLAGL
jgi:aspartate-semialdehyde dehydrogenase